MCRLRVGTNTGVHYDKDQYLKVEERWKPTMASNLLFQTITGRRGFIKGSSCSRVHDSSSPLGSRYSMKQVPPQLFPISSIRDPVA